MIDSDVNFDILKNKNVQEKIIDESSKIAKLNSFNGIVLDFETSSLSFATVTNEITDFMTLYAQKVHAQNLKFAITLYGDTFYLSRPYDVAKLAKVTDEVFIMAYDFTKSRDNPGPNFPYGGTNIYGYDFQTMIRDFEKNAPADKLTPVFGMFGYDWIVDSQGHSVGDGTSLALTDIQGKFINTCIAKNCSESRDSASAEPEIKYIDSDNKNHVIWFEDNESVGVKVKFLGENGISSTAYWAYTYY